MKTNPCHTDTHLLLLFLITFICDTAYKSDVKMSI